VLAPSLAPLQLFSTSTLPTRANCGGSSSQSRYVRTAVGRMKPLPLSVCFRLVLRQHFLSTASRHTYGGRSLLLTFSAGAILSFVLLFYFPFIHFLLTPATPHHSSALIILTSSSKLGATSLPICVYLVAGEGDNSWWLQSCLLSTQSLHHPLVSSFSGTHMLR